MSSTFCLLRRHGRFFFFFFNDTATTEIYTLSLHDALPISDSTESKLDQLREQLALLTLALDRLLGTGVLGLVRSEEHTSELQSRLHLVCRLLLEKKKINFAKRVQRAVIHRQNSANHHSHTQ